MAFSNTRMTRLCIVLAMGFVLTAVVLLQPTDTHGDQCSWFDFPTSVLHIPCFYLNEQSFHLHLSLDSGDPVQLGLSSIYGGLAPGTACAVYDFSKTILHIPCVFIGTKSYWIDLSPVTMDPLILQLSDIGANIPNTAMHSASGNYGYSTSKNILTLITTSSDFIDEGPPLGVIQLDIVSITPTTMMVIDDDDYAMTWTRESGSSNSIVGTWKLTDEHGSTMEATFEPQGSFVIIGRIVVNP